MRASHHEREDAPLLLPEPDSDGASTSTTAQHVTISNWQLAGLYTTHTFSMWNMRSYEFAAVLLVSAAYPHTLTVASLRGLTANLASLSLAPAVGRWCNQSKSRLRTLQTCIIVQRICIGLACFAWTLIIPSSADDPDHGETMRKHQLNPLWAKHAIMATIILLGMIEKLGWVGDVVTIEREWVPMLANVSSKPALHTLNANIKRIDLISKLVAPLAVNAVVLGLKDLQLVALLIAAMQVVAVVPEITAAWRVWRSSEALQMPKVVKLEDTQGGGRNPMRAKSAIWSGLIRRFFASSVCLPSIAWVIQPLSVLTLSASMMIYLLSIGFPLEHVTVARTLSTTVEITSTIITPLLISWLRHRSNSRSEDESKHFQPLIIVGLLGLSFQLCMLIPAVASLLILPDLATDPTKSFPVWTKVLLISLALSRFGPFAYALIEQQLIQVTIPADRRLEFSGIEFALFSFAELGRWTLTGVFGKPEQFKGVAIFSFGAIVIAASLFWWWTWRWKERLLVVQDEDSPSTEPHVD